MSNTNVAELFPYTTAEESVTEKDWACGSREQAQFTEFVMTPTGAKYTQVVYSPAWWKIIDEPIVNALDHFIRQLGSMRPVTKIVISVDKVGRIRIYNDGPGVPADIHPVASQKMGREIRVPTLIFGELFQGSNRKQEPDCIIGGTNGMGSKLIVLFASDHIVETVHSDTYFCQRWRDCKRVEEVPVVMKLNTKHNLPKDRTIPHTVLSFLPDYIGKFGYSAMTEEIAEQLTNVIRMRAYYAAAYVGYTLTSVKSKAKCEVVFNDSVINVKSIADVARLLFPDAQVITTLVTPVAPLGKYQHNKYPWEVCAVITNTSALSQKHVSVVNGIIVTEGKHLEKIADLITDGVKEKITKMLGSIKFTKSHVTDNMFLMINTKIPLPAWTGQRKEVLSTDKRAFSGYTLDTKFINAVSEGLKDAIMENVLGRVKRKKTVDMDKLYGDKYQQAGAAGGKESAKCKLILCEGDSAKSQVQTGITKTIGIKHHGTMSTGGVFPNAQKECTVIRSPTGKKIITMSPMFAGNRFILAFLAATGLDPQCDYDKSSTTYRKEMSDLNYGQVIAAVDQDLDGKGFILTLIQGMFELFWPCLLNAGFLGWFITPIIRAYPNVGSKVESFYNLPEYDAWEQSQGGAAAVKARYEVYPYKGLGTHSPEETAHMFKTFYDNIRTFYTDERTRETVKAYLGDEPKLRKNILSRPPVPPPSDLIAEQILNKRISVTDHMLYEADEFQRDNLDRKLNHVIDGQNQAGRKILDGIIKFVPGSVKSRIEKFAGDISKHENYHHGAASLMSSIQGKAFLAVGGKQLPFLIPKSMLGDRMCGGENAAAPRYTDVVLNIKLIRALFPAEDYYMLEFNFDEGMRGEPRFFIPVLPLVLCESCELPGHGWKIKMWARDVFAIIENVRILIKYGDTHGLLSMPPARRSGVFTYRGKFDSIRGSPYSFGKYNLEDAGGAAATIDTATHIHITELPLRVWTNKYVADLKKKQVSHPELIASVSKGNSNDVDVDIKIELMPGALDKILQYGDSMFTDGVEEFFQLRNHMDSHINLMTADGSVAEYKDYTTVMYNWFIARKELYSARIDRKLELLRILIIKILNIIRYIEIFKTLDIPNQTYARMNEILAKHEFTKLDAGLLSSPKFTPTAELNDAILGADGNYDYLLKTSDLKKSAEALAKYKKKIVDLEAEIDSIKSMAGQGRFRGAVLFEQELAHAEDVIKKGLATNWEFEKYKKYQL